MLPVGADAIVLLMAGKWFWSMRELCPVYGGLVGLADEEEFGYRQDYFEAVRVEY